MFILSSVHPPTHSTTYLPTYLSKPPLRNDTSAASHLILPRPSTFSSFSFSPTHPFRYISPLPSPPSTFRSDLVPLLSVYVRILYIFLDFSHKKKEKRIETKKNIIDVTCPHPQPKSPLCRGHRARSDLPERSCKRLVTQTVTQQRIAPIRLLHLGFSG